MCTYTKLQTGDWGVRGRQLMPGATVTVTKKDGTTKTETIGQVVKTFEDGNQIATIAKRAKRPVFQEGPRKVQAANDESQAAKVVNPDAPFVTKLEITVPNTVLVDFLAAIEIFRSGALRKLRGFEQDRFQIKDDAGRQVLGGQDPAITSLPDTLKVLADAGHRGADTPVSDRGPICPRCQSYCFGDCAAEIQEAAQA